MENKQVIVAVSGGFDPVHIGHVRMFKEAKAIGDKLIVVLNNDHWLRKKKGSAFMPEDERIEILKSIKYVDDVVLTDHQKNPEDMSVCSSLAKIKPDIFANGGDRKEDNIPEYQLCQELGIRMIFNVGGSKIQSSSWLIERGKKTKENEEKIKEESTEKIKNSDKEKTNEETFIGVTTGKKINFQDKKVIIADVDDTICESCQQITAEMAGQISKMIRQGYQFAFISGTKISDLKKMVSSRIKENHHLLATTGTNYTVIENGESQNVYNISFTEDEKKEIIGALEKLTEHYNIKSMTTKEDQIQDRDSQITLSAIGRNAPSELKADYDPKGEKRKVWIEFLKTILNKEKYELKIGGTTSIDITRKGLDKGWGIKQFLENKGWEAKKVIFFGDKIYPGGNDYEASKVVDCIAVKNPEEALQKLKKLSEVP